MQGKILSPNDYNNETIVKLGESLPVLELHNKIEEGLNAITVPTILILGWKRWCHKKRRVLRIL